MCVHPLYSLKTLDAYLQLVSATYVYWHIQFLTQLSVIQIAGADPLRDEGFAYADRLVRAGVRTTVKVYPGLPHGFYFFTQLEEARQFIEEVTKFIKSL